MICVRCNGSGRTSKGMGHWDECSSCNGKGSIGSEAFMGGISAAGPVVHGLSGSLPSVREFIERGRAAGQDAFGLVNDVEFNGWDPIVVPRGPSILVEGPDGVGKTTVCAHMSEMTGIPVFKAPSEKRIFREGGRQSLAFDHTLVSFLEQTGYRFISDRCYISELVYSKVFGRETDMGLLRLIDDAHARLGTMVLYLYSSELPAREDDLVPTEKYWDVKAGYDAVFKEWSHIGGYGPGGPSPSYAVQLDTAEMLRAYQGGGDISREFATKCLHMLGEIA